MLEGVEEARGRGPRLLEAWLRVEEEEELEEVQVVEEGGGVVTMLVWDSHFSTRISILGDIPVNFFLATGRMGGTGGRGRGDIVNNSEYHITWKLWAVTTQRSGHCNQSQRDWV